MNLATEFGPIDIYLFDQILRGRVPPGSRVFDAGCGGGRNLVYFVRQGYEVFGADADPQAISAVLQLGVPAENFRTEPLERLSFDDKFDFVIASAVLHFAHDHEHFEAMLAGAWRLVRPGGILFARLASSIGIEKLVQPLGQGRFLLPDGSERYLVNEARLLQLTSDLQAELLDPIKTTIVQSQRAMTTWVLRRLG